MRPRPEAGDVDERVEGDLIEPGDQDLVRKLLRDFADHGVPTTEAEVRAQLQAMHRVAWLQPTTTD